MKKKIIFITIVVILLLGFYLYFQNNVLQVSTYNIANSMIPKRFNGYKIIQISDFHNTDSKKLNSDLIEEIKVRKPNIIVITGDLVDSRNTNIDVVIDFIKKIKNIAPIFYVSGNHEASIGEYELLKEKLEKEDVTILDNKVEVLEVEDSKINIIGVDDPNMSYHPDATDALKVGSELSEINYDKNNFTILLSHRPELFDVYVNNSMNLVLTGHAHGGQVRIPFIGGVVAPNQGLFPKYDSGKFLKDETTMIVSRGIGNSIVPFRINNRPELVEIVLNNK